MLIAKSVSVLLIVLGCMAVPVHAGDSVRTVAAALEYSGPSPFAPMGEAENLCREMSNNDIRTLMQKKIDANPADAHSLCVVAEMMKRLGDTRAETYYGRAIAARPKEPAYNFWYGQYLRIYRGLNYAAEKQYYIALAKLREREKAGFALKDDPLLLAWINRGLINNYQDWGLPLLSSKAYPYQGAGQERTVGAFLMSAVDYGDLPVDFGQLNQTLGFTSLKGFFNYGLYEALKDSLTQHQIDNIARTSERFNTINRLRLYLPFNAAPALDLRYGYNTSRESQFFSRFFPDSFVDTRSTTIGGGLTKSYNLNPVCDLKVEANYDLVRRVGMVEMKPAIFENVNKIDARIDLSRFISSDKLTLSAFAVYLDIPEQGFTVVEKRAKFIAGGMVDYAFYRAVPLPVFEYGGLTVKRKNLRGVHLFGGYMIDQEVWDTEMRQDDFVVFGTHVKGLGRFDFSLFPMMFFGTTSIADSLLDSRNFKQFRTNFVTRFRIIDEEVTPWLPDSWWAFHPASLELALPVRHDFALAGTDPTYENIGVGIELWSKVIAKPLRGTTYLCTGAYEFQRYYILGKNLHNFHFDIRMGWGRI